MRIAGEVGEFQTLPRIDGHAQGKRNVTGPPVVRLGYSVDVRTSPVRKPATEAGPPTGFKGIDDMPLQKPERILLEFIPTPEIIVGLVQENRASQFETPFVALVKYAELRPYNNPVTAEIDQFLVIVVTKGKLDRHGRPDRRIHGVFTPVLGELFAPQRRSPIQVD